MDWVPVMGFPGYSIHPTGQVQRDLNGRLLHIKVNQYGLAYVGLMRDGEQCQRSLALLVANAFIPRPYEAFDTPINLDGDRLNCAVDNLMWRPLWFARKYNQQFEDRYMNPIAGYVRDVNSQEYHRGSLAAAMAYGLLERDVVLSIFNKTYTWPTYQVFEVAE